MGYGFIKFETEKDAEKAAKELNQKSLEGREVNVAVARPPKTVGSGSSEEEEEAPHKTRNNKRSNKSRQQKSSVSILEL
jgi:RNA recognition motif-containing protein